MPVPPRRVTSRLFLRADRPFCVSSRMPIPRLVLVAIVIAIITLGSSGCVMRRTVTERNQVVAQGYVVKAPVLAP